MSFINETLDGMKQYERLIENDGHIGIKVGCQVLFDKARFKVIKGYGGTPIMIYVINTQAKRYGTLSDEEIVKGMLDRGYVVLVLDYFSDEKAVGYALDLSVQGIRRKLMEGYIFEDIDCIGKGSYPETLVVPSGCDVSYGNVYWELDKHGADGTLEKITEIWNNDFRGTKGEVLIKWTDENGERKATQSAHDGTQPFWCNEKGERDENGSYIMIKYTLAKDVTDCVKRDGTMIDLKLYMHIVYPTRPKQKHPVMCLANSSENLCAGSATADRPHMNGFLFRGYVGVLYDYCYTPMARSDHYGYFDGYPKKGYITGDNGTYSLKTYNVFSDNAAMRFIRYLALSQGDKYAFDINAIGVYGNSKGGWMTYLGEKDPGAMGNQRIFKGHHGETRYENGDTESRKGVNGGELQPFLTYQGKSIWDGADLIYSSCGATWFGVTRGHTPLFVSCNRRDESCYSTSNSLVNLGRVCNVPTMWLEIPLPHTITYGEDLLYGIDAYEALFEFSGYYLYRKAIKALGVRVNNDLFPASVTVLFSGAVERSEAEKIIVTDINGNAVAGEMEGCYGGCEWTFTPSTPLYGGGYKLTVPSGICGDNGKRSEKERSFDIAFANGMSISLNEADKTEAPQFTKRYIAFEVKNDGVNTVCAYDADGNTLGKINTAGKGWYKIEMQGPVYEGVRVKAEKSCADVAPCAPLKLSGNAKGGAGVAPDGKEALRVDGFGIVTRFPTEELYMNPEQAVRSDCIVKEEALDESDVGRRFKISFKVYDTVSRHMNFGLNHCSSRPQSIADYRRAMDNVITRKGEWTEYELDYVVYEPVYGDYGKHKKSFYISCFGNGNIDTPIYFADLKCNEIVTDVEIGRMCAVFEEDKRYLPLGLSEIECEKSPWSK